MQGHDVGVLDLLQDVHLPLDLLSLHAAAAGPALPLLDELGGVFDACAFVRAAFDDRKLPAADTNGEGDGGPGQLRNHGQGGISLPSVSFLKTGGLLIIKNRIEQRQASWEETLCQKQLRYRSVVHHFPFPSQRTIQ